MPNIIFYSYKEKTEHSTLPIAHIVNVITAAYRKKQNVFINTSSQKQAECIDEALWTQEPNNFLPHQLVGEDPQTRPPIEIGYKQSPNIRSHILMNLAMTVPDFYVSMQWIIEYAYGAIEEKEHARQKFRFYRNHHCLIQHHLIEPIKPRL
jgi:DNA polymerase-3 subunit chi